MAYNPQEWPVGGFYCLCNGRISWELFLSAGMLARVTPPCVRSSFIYEIIPAQETGNSHLEKDKIL